MDNREKLIEILTDDYCPLLYMQGDVGNLADYLIANGVTIQKWIPVADPPKERGCYLITVKHWLDGKPVTREAKWNGVDWLSCYRREEITPRVTHWMPLPEVPKED